VSFSFFSSNLLLTYRLASPISTRSQNRKPSGDFATERRIFEDYAEKNKFDPLNPENWYRQRTKKMKATKEVKDVIVRTYNNRTSKALMHLFPEIGLDKLRFAISSRWAVPENRRLFF